MELLQLLVSGIAQGCVYGLIALGFVLIYKATETVTFAQGDLMMLGAFGGFIAMSAMGLPFWAAAIATVIVMTLLGVGLERVVIRPILGQPAFSIIMLTIGVAYVLRGAITMIIWRPSSFGANSILTSSPRSSRTRSRTRIPRSW